MDSCEKICRVCLQSGANLDYTSIFASGHEIAPKIFEISSVKIAEQTEETAVICQICLKELFQCILFRKKCQSSDEYFRATLPKAEEPEGTEELKKEESDGQANVNVELQTEDFLVSQFHDSDGNDVEEFYEIKFLDEKSKTVKCKPTRKKPTEKKISSLQCRYCGIRLSRRNRRIEHERLHLIDQTQQLYECSFCGKSFNQKFGLIPHFKKYHNFTIGPTEKWKCAICVNKVLPPGNMALHYETYHSDVCCAYNSKALATNLDQFADVIEPKRAPRTRKQSGRPKPPVNFWPCSICGNSFSNYQRYHRHLKEVHEVNCNQVIQETAALQNSAVISYDYNAEKQNDKSVKFPCTTCGKAFASVMTVRAHEKTHLNVEYICDHCGSSFRVKAYLTAHVQKVHMKLKKFKCSIENCSASFVHRELLNYHVRKHLNIRNFSCRYCGKTFVTRSCCKIHERIHTDERPYSCKYCERTFIHHSDHRRHEMRHEAKHNNFEATEEKQEFQVAEQFIIDG